MPVAIAPPTAESIHARAPVKVPVTAPYRLYATVAHAISETIAVPVATIHALVAPPATSGIVELYP